MLSNFVTSWIRTTIPIVVGTVVAWLNARYSWIDIDTAQATAWAVGGTVAVYYTVVHWLVQRFPKVGVLLGVPKLPYYKPPVDPAFGAPLDQ